MDSLPPEMQNEIDAKQAALEEARGRAKTAIHRKARCAREVKRRVSETELKAVARPVRSVGDP